MFGLIISLIVVLYLSITFTLLFSILENVVYTRKVIDSKFIKYVEVKVCPHGVEWDDCVDCFH